MSSQNHMSSQADDSYETFLGRNGWSEKYCIRLAQRRNWPIEDAKDIYAVGIGKFWKTYFSKLSKKAYQRRSEAEERKMLRNAFTWSACDLQRQKDKDAILEQAISLDAPMSADANQNGATFADIITTGVSSGENVLLQLIFEEAITEYRQNAKSLHKKSVIDFLLGKIDEHEIPDLGHYSSSYTRVIKNEFKEFVKLALGIIN